ncbi:MAG TPA: hypothetical protein VI588_00255, partial [Candidatus Gracilibacteria bacterium]|nr:hypothetical protein [Candidatus Gracilibacteria bacterium]
KRIACVKKILGIDKLLPVADYCKGEDGDCAETYTLKIHNLIKFRFYDLEERIEDWYRDGKMTLDETVNFVVMIAESKIAFNEASNKTARKAIIINVMHKWNEVIEGISQ